MSLTQNSFFLCLGSRREACIDFNLSTVPSDHLFGVLQSVQDTTTRKSYERPQMQLEVSITPRMAEIVLLCGKTVDMMGRRGAAGYPLGHLPEPIYFSGSMRA